MYKWKKYKNSDLVTNIINYQVKNVKYKLFLNLQNIYLNKKYMIKNLL